MQIVGKLGFCQIKKKPSAIAEMQRIHLFPFEKTNKMWLIGPHSDGSFQSYKRLKKITKIENLTFFAI